MFLCGMDDYRFHGTSQDNFARQSRNPLYVAVLLLTTCHPLPLFYSTCTSLHCI